MRIATTPSLLLALAACSAPMSTDPTASDPTSGPVTTPTVPVDGECPVGIDVGSCAPDFTLLNADGTPVSLSDRVGDRLVVVGSSLW